MSTSKNDTKSFVKEVTKHLRGEGTSLVLTKKVGTLLSKMSLIASGRINATVESTISLTNVEQRQLSSILGKAARAPVSLTFRENRDLLSGLKIRMGDILIDTSGKMQLLEMVWTLS